MSRTPIVLLLTAIAGCTPERYRHHEPLTDGRWALVTASFLGPQATTPAATVELRGPDLRAYSGCNTATGAFRAIDGRWLDTGPLATTRMACASALGKFEQRFFAMLASKPNFLVQGDTLTLSIVDDSIVLRRVAAPEKTP